MRRRRQRAARPPPAPQPAAAAHRRDLNSVADGRTKRAYQMWRERGGNTHGEGAAGSTMKGGIERGGGRATHNRGGQGRAKRGAGESGSGGGRGQPVVVPPLGVRRAGCTDARFCFFTSFACRSSSVGRPFDDGSVRLRVTVTIEPDRDGGVSTTGDSLSASPASVGNFSTSWYMSATTHNAI